MIDNELPVMNPVTGYDDLQNDIRRDRNRRRAGVAAAAALILAATTTAVLLSQGGDKNVEPAPEPLPNQVIVQDPDGAISFVAGNGTRHTINAENVQRYALSPDGAQLAWISSRSPDEFGGTLWIANADGTDRHRLPAPCDGCRAGLGVAWSNDGTRLAYSVYTPAHQPVQLRVRTLTTGDEQVLRFPGLDDARGARFSPDDRQLAFTTEGDSGQSVATVDLDQGVSSMESISDSYTQVQLPNWSTDGKTVYFTATTSGDNSADPFASNNLYAAVPGGPDRQITQAVGGERYFGVTPYGDRFLISRAQGEKDWVTGWLSQDGSQFTPMRGPDGKPVEGSGAFLQP